MGMILCLICSLQTQASDDAALPFYFAGLRSLGLFRVAEEYALSRLAEPELSPAQHAILAVELSKIFASHAAEASSENESIELWKRAEESLSPLLNNRDNPRWRAVRSRQATLQCDRALAEFWKSQLAPDSETQREVALATVRAALVSLESAVAEIKDLGLPANSKARPDERRTKPLTKTDRQTEGALTAIENRRIVDELEYLIVRMNLSRARLLPIGPDRAAALIDAEQQSAALTRHVNSDYIWPVRLARVEAIRLQGEPEKALSYANSLRSDELSEELSDALVAEQARSKLAMKSPTDAIQWIVEYGQSKSAPSQSRLSPELRSIVIECLIASVQVAQGKGDQSLVDDLWKQATAQQQLVTGPWRTYADSLLARSNETRLYGEKLAAIVREGRAAAQRRDWATSVAAYKKAVAQATAEGNPALAAEFTFMQASIEIESGQFQQAAQLLQEYPTRFPGEARVIESHLLAAWTLGKINDEKPSTAHRTEYISQLKDHVAMYPNSPTTIEAQWSLAVDAIQHQEWITAVDFLEAISPGHARSMSAEAQLPYCYEQGFAVMVDRDQRSSCEQRAKSSLNRQLESWPQPPAGWTLTQSETALRWARLLLRLSNRPYKEADELLSQILHSRDIEAREVARDSSRLDPAWDRLVPAVTQLRIISLAGLGQMVEAEKLFATATMASAEDLLAILSGLSDLASSLNEQSRRDLGRVQLAAARRLEKQRASLTPEFARLVDRCVAEAYVATGDLPEAIGLYESLLKKNPRDKSLLETIGTLSLKRGKIEDLKRAKSIYRQLEALDPAGSSTWLRTRLVVARLSWQLGEKAECAKLIQVTRILYPEMGGESLKAEYAELEKQLTDGK